MNFEDFINSMFKAANGGDGDGEEDDKNDRSSMFHPDVADLFKHLSQTRNERVEKQQQEIGEEATLEENNPGGIICGLQDYLVFAFINSPMGALALISDKLSGEMNPSLGKPGRFLHTLMHLCFDMGRQFEYEAQQRGEDWLRKEQEPENVDVPAPFKEFFEHESDDPGDVIAGK